MSAITLTVERIGELEELMSIYSDLRDKELKELVRLFRLRRKEAKVSLRDAAKKLKVSPAYLSDVELGRRYISEDNFDKWVDYFDSL